MTDSVPGTQTVIAAQFCAWFLQSGRIPRSDGLERMWPARPRRVTEAAQPRAADAQAVERPDRRTAASRNAESPALRGFLRSG
jgi:hypothetical protein